MSRRRIELGRRKKRVGVGADREESRIAQIKQSRVTDNHVQPDREEDEVARSGRVRDERGALRGIDGDDRKQEGDDDQDAVDRRIPVADSLPQVEWPAAARGCRLAHFSGTRMPNRPVGLNTSTPMRMPKITTCVHLEPM